METCMLTQGCSFCHLVMSMAGVPWKGPSGLLWQRPSELSPHGPSLPGSCSEAGVDGAGRVGSQDSFNIMNPEACRAKPL